MFSRLVSGVLVVLQIMLPASLPRPAGEPYRPALSIQSSMATQALSARTVFSRFVSVELRPVRTLLAGLAVAALAVPAYLSAAVQAPAMAFQSAANSLPAVTWTSEIITKGWTLTQYAAKHHTTVEALQSLNHIADPDKIYEGRELLLPLIKKITMPLSHGQTPTALPELQDFWSVVYNALSWLSGWGEWFVWGAAIVLSAAALAGLLAVILKVLRESSWKRAAAVLALAGILGHGDIPFFGAIAQTARTAAAKTESANLIAAKGVIRRVDVEIHEVTVKHDHIDHAKLRMPAMTMVFPVAKAVPLQNFKAGQKIRFMLARHGKDGKELLIEEMTLDKPAEPAKPSAPAPTPAPPPAAAPKNEPPKKEVKKTAAPRAQVHPALGLSSALFRRLALVPDQERRERERADAETVLETPQASVSVGLFAGITTAGVSGGLEGDVRLPMRRLGDRKEKIGQVHAAEAARRAAMTRQTWLDDEREAGLWYIQNLQADASSESLPTASPEEPAIAAYALWEAVSRAEIRMREARRHLLSKIWPDLFSWTVRAAPPIGIPSFIYWRAGRYAPQAEAATIQQAAADFLALRWQTQQELRRSLEVVRTPRLSIQAENPGVLDLEQAAAFQRRQTQALYHLTAWGLSPKSHPEDIAREVDSRFRQSLAPLLPVARAGLDFLERHGMNKTGERELRDAFGRVGQLPEGPASRADVYAARNLAAASALREASDDRLVQKMGAAGMAYQRVGPLDVSPEAPSMTTAGSTVWSEASIRLPIRPGKAGGDLASLRQAREDAARAQAEQNGNQDFLRAEDNRVLQESAAAAGEYGPWQAAVDADRQSSQVPVAEAAFHPEASLRYWKARYQEAQARWELARQGRLDIKAMARSTLEGERAGMVEINILGFVPQQIVRRVRQVVGKKVDAHAVREAAQMREIVQHEALEALHQLRLRLLKVEARQQGLKRELSVSIDTPHSRWVRLELARIDAQVTALRAELETWRADAASLQEESNRRWTARLREALEKPINATRPPRLIATEEQLRYLSDPRNIGENFSASLSAFGMGMKGPMGNTLRTGIAGGVALADTSVQAAKSLARIEVARLTIEHFETQHTLRREHARALAEAEVWKAAAIHLEEAGTHPANEPEAQARLLLASAQAFTRARQSAAEAGVSLEQVPTVSLQGPWRSLVASDPEKVAEEVSSVCPCGGTTCVLPLPDGVGKNRHAEIQGFSGWLRGARGVGLKIGSWRIFGKKTEQAALKKWNLELEDLRTHMKSNEAVMNLRIRRLFDLQKQRLDQVRQSWTNLQNVSETAEAYATRLENLAQALAKFFAAHEELRKDLGVYDQMIPSGAESLGVREIPVLLEGAMPIPYLPPTGSRTLLSAA